MSSPPPVTEQRPLSVTRNSQSALLLCEQGLSSDDRNLAALLDFFGVPWSSVTLDAIACEQFVPRNNAGQNNCVLSSASQLALAMKNVAKSSGSLPPWLRGVDSIYVYAFQDSPLCLELLQILTQDPRARILDLNAKRVSMSVTSDFPEMCKSMSGVRSPANLNHGDCAFHIPSLPAGFQNIITTDDGIVFCGLMYGGVRVYLNACCKTIDLTRSLTKYFDVKDYFPSAVPAVMYIKWACSNVCWNSAETSACVIVDDPLLKSRYGFLQFREALHLMDQHDFATTIGFIPWNWHRTHPPTVRMFQQRSDRFSVSVHGCDHTASEFATTSTASLNTRIKVALHRMDRLRENTSLPYDQVMIFPQGAFSPEAGFALKVNGFVAAVNTEVAPFNDTRNRTTISDVWDVAIMKYGAFPIFTRRYLTHGIENFAFDGLLGKPCFIVGHHDTFKDHGEHLADFIVRLNSLNWTLHWRPLGNAIARSFKIRNGSNETNVIQMFAEKMIIGNTSVEPREALVLKEQDSSASIKSVLANQKPIDASAQGNSLRFSVPLAARQSTEVQILYRDTLSGNPTRTSVVYAAKTRLRRYLSEFRDNYLSQSDLLANTAGAIKQRLTPSSSRSSA